MSDVEYGFEVVPVTDKSQGQVAGVGTGTGTGTGRGESEKGDMLHLHQQHLTLERNL